MVDLVNSGGKSNADIGVILDDIVSLSRNFQISISFVPRAANNAAHLLAKLALSSVSNLSGLEVCPPFLESIVCLESSPSLGG